MLTDYRDVPLDLQHIAMEWFDGETDALYKFYRGKPVTFRALERSVRCVLDTNLVKSDEREAARIKKLLAFVEARAKLEKLEGDIQRAIKRALDAGIAEHDVRDVCANSDNRLRWRY